MLAINRMKLVVLAAALVLAAPKVLAQGDDGSMKPFKLDARTDQYMDGPSYPAYPAYPTFAPPVQPPPQKKPPKLKAKAEQNVQPTPRPPMQATIQQSPPLQANVQASPPPGVLPGGFLGQWMVMGSRAKVEALPQYANGIDSIFTASNNQTWNIVGNPGGYSMSSSSGVSQVQVGQCTASTAYIRYQHQIKNTMAQEAIVMQISPDGRHFQGMQRISIVKPGEGQPRATVTYNLIGQR